MEKEPILESCQCCLGKKSLPSHFSKGTLVHSCLWCNETGMVVPEVNRAYQRIRKIGPVRYCSIFGADEQPKEI